MNIAIGADHGGLELKNVILEALSADGHMVTDYGTHSKDSVDYPDIVHAVAPEVASGQYDLGILCCTSGIGMSIGANKVQGVRAAKVDKVSEAIITRQHNDANILCLGQNSVSAEEAVEIARAFLSTESEGGRHQRRVCKLSSGGLSFSDPEVSQAIDEELLRQRNHIELIASENFASPAVMAAQGSVLTNKYAEGNDGF